VPMNRNIFFRARNQRPIIPRSWWKVPHRRKRLLGRIAQPLWRASLRVRLRCTLLFKCAIFRFTTLILRQQFEDDLNSPSGSFWTNFYTIMTRWYGWDCFWVRMRSFTSLLSVIPTKISGQSTMTVYLTFSWRESPCLAFLRGLGLRFSEFFFQRLDLLACSFSKQLPLLLQITHTYVDWGCGRLIFGRLCAGLRMRL